MADEEAKKSTKTKSSDTTPGPFEKADGTAGSDQVQELMDDHLSQGFRGTETDPTPNENYSVAGVVNGAPTPETDPEARKAAYGQVYGDNQLAGG